MAAVADTPRAPFLANLVVILGFVSVFSTFATDAAASWILGVLLIVAGGIWAGFHGQPSSPEGVAPVGTATDTAPAHDEDAGGTAVGGPSDSSVR